ncbi:hypothetical protein L9F63_022765, partial [Diploptera punctata]
HMLGMMYGFSLVDMVFIVIITLYTTLDDLRTQDYKWAYLFSTLAPLVICALNLYFICDNGHQLHTQ